MSLDVMKQALEALEMVMVDVKTTPNAYEASRQAITALRAAIEQAQEPVAWYFVRDLEKGISFAPDNDATKSWQPLYPALPAATEPVAWMVYTLDGKSVCVTDNPNDFTDQHKVLPLYTSPRQWKGLTDEDREEILRWVEWKEIGSQPVAPQKLIAYVEKKLREKNT